MIGGVSSDIWRRPPGRPRRVKRALSKLRVASEWHAPVVRDLYEARWMRRAAAIVPDAVPKLLGQDGTSGTVAVQDLPPDRYPVWKAELRNGQVDPVFASSVAATLVRIHAVTAADPTVAAEFATDAIFYEIRLEPYLLAAAHAQPDHADVLRTLVTSPARQTRWYGDVSPEHPSTGRTGVPRCRMRVVGRSRL